MIILETDRLLLRYMLPEDIHPLVDLWTDAGVTCFMGGPRELQSLTQNLTATANNPLAEAYDLWPLIEKTTGQVIGHCGLLEKEVDGQQEIELVYVLAKAAWGKGFATEISLALRDYGFHQKGLSRLIALIEPENAASERVAVKAGMRLEKEVMRPDGAERKVYVVHPSTNS
ncbi:MAG TPA: GNAT family N-acetyltransferase [Leptolinea sp.]